MQAVILAAGMGKRLGEYTKNNTKCMLEVCGKKLIDRALDSLAAVGVSRVVIVVGYKGENVKAYVGGEWKGIPVEYVDNPIYDRTNNIYSLRLAGDYLQEDDTLLLESDLIFDPSVLRRLVENPYPDLALVARYESWMDGTVVTVGPEGRILRFIDKNGFRYGDTPEYYKTVNIYKFSREFLTRYYIPFLSAYSAALGDNEYYEQVLGVLLHLHGAPLRALPLEGESWYEIDDAQDFEIATAMFSPTAEERYSAISSHRGGFWRFPSLLDFSELSNHWFPSDRMRDEMRASFDTLLCSRPSSMAIDSLVAAKNFSLRPDQVVCGNGADELKRAMGEDAVFVTNPDPCSGKSVAYEELLSLVHRSGEEERRIIVDESFVDLSSSRSLLDRAVLDNNPHLAVIRSLDAPFGVPGLRLAMLASSDRELISSLSCRFQGGIDSFAEFFLQIYEKYGNAYLESCKRFKEEREWLSGELLKINGLGTVPGDSVFISCRPLSGMSSRQLAVRLFEKGILVSCDDCIRLAVRTREDNLKLLQALRSVFSDKR